MTKICGKVIVSFLALVALDAYALSCGISSEQALVDRNSHIFFAVVTSAVFIPADDGVQDAGKVIAQFEVLEVLKGDPTRVPHIEANVRGANEDWPAQIYLGRRYLVFSDGGPVRFSACSDLYRDTGRENWCLEYQIRKRVGQAVSENTTCEAAYILRAMENRGLKPESNRNDLDGLRQEWVIRFGALPE